MEPREYLAAAIERGIALNYVPFTFADEHPHHNRPHRLLVTYVHLFEDCANKRGDPADLDLQTTAARVRQGKAPTESHNHPVILCPDCTDRLAVAYKEGTPA